MARQRSKSEMARLLREQERRGLAKISRMKQAERAKFWENLKLSDSKSGTALARQVSESSRREAAKAKVVASRVVGTTGRVHQVPFTKKALPGGVPAVGPANWPLGPDLPPGGVGGGGWFDKIKAHPKQAIKDFAKKPEAKWLGATVLLELLGRTALGAYEMHQGAKIQGAEIDMQGQYAPQIAEQQALQPVTEARKEQALAMLMRQMGQSVPNLAEGEVWT